MGLGRLLEACQVHEKVALEHSSKSTKYELEGSYGDPVHEHFSFSGVPRPSFNLMFFLIFVFVCGISRILGCFHAIRRKKLCRFVVSKCQTDDSGPIS